MVMRGSDAAWNRYGEIDPYFGVVSHDRFRRENLDDTAVAEFFRSGQAHVDWLLRVIRDCVDADFTPRRALDFGCGVGRLLIPLARISHQVVGVDVSEGMLHEARRNCASHGVLNAEVTRSDDRLSRVDGTFDFVHSWIVFQHVPPPRGMALLREIVGRLERGGVGALHFTYRSTAPPAQRARAWLRSRVPGVNALVNLARGRSPSYPVMQMNAYDLNRIVALLQGAGCDRVHAHLTDHGGHLGAILVFRKSRATEADYQP
jgi:ubiquinone/menaquinone biosynthesis C-methylase UbiE